MRKRVRTSFLNRSSLRARTRGKNLRVRGGRKGTSNATVYAIGCAGRRFVKIHKESLVFSPLVDMRFCERAQNPLIKAIIMQFTIISHKSSVVKYFFEKNEIFFRSEIL